jgi:hypothetical protein
MAFDSKGSDEYLEAWASLVDRMANEGWEAFECVRSPQRFGLWTVFVVQAKSESLPPSDQSGSFP